MYSETETMQRILILLPTYNTNFELMEDLDINIDVVFEPEDPDVIQKKLLLLKKKEMIM
jgi:hypothetical protein